MNEITKPIALDETLAKTNEALRRIENVLKTGKSGTVMVSTSIPQRQTLMRRSSIWKTPWE